MRARELRVLEVEVTSARRELEATSAELEKYAALADSDEDLETRIGRFSALIAERDEERSIVEDKRGDLLNERARLRLAPRRLRVPIALGLGLGAAGAAAGAVGYPAGYVLAGAGILALVVALGAARIARIQLGRIETFLAVLRVRERTSERRFEADGAPVRAMMLALGADSLDALRNAARGVAQVRERAEAEKRRLAELEQRFPAEARSELARIDQRGDFQESSPAVRAARAALLACPADPPPPELPPLPAISFPADMDSPLEADTAVELVEKPDEDPEPAPDEAGPDALVASAARVVGRSEAEVRARLGPILPVYLRALSMGTFTHARAADGGGFVLRGATRDEQDFAQLPDRERDLVRLAVQLALLEALASDRRVPLLVGPSLPSRGDAEQRALARALKRLASVVQVIQVVTEAAPWSEHAGKSFEL